MVTRFCPNCGSDIADTDMFCANCGTPIDQAPNNTDQPTTLLNAGQQPPATAPAPAEQNQPTQSPSGARHRHMAVIIIAAVVVVVLAVCGALLVGYHARKLSADCASAVSELQSANRGVSKAERQARQASKLKASDLADSTVLDDFKAVLKNAPADVTIPSCAMSLSFGRLKADIAKVHNQADQQRAYSRKLTDTARKVLDSQNAAKLTDVRDRLMSARDKAKDLLASSKNMIDHATMTSLRKAVNTADDMLSSGSGVSISDMSDALDAVNKAMKAVNDALPPSVGGLRTYRNARFGYSVAVPDSYRWGKESADGAGRSFTDTSGKITISVSGENNTSGATPESLQSAMAAGHSDITYQTHGPNFAVVSYYENGQGVYIKKFVNAGTIATLHLQWPAELTDSTGGPLTEQTEDSFRPGNDTAS